MASTNIRQLVDTLPLLASSRDSFVTLLADDTMDIVTIRTIEEHGDLLNKIIGSFPRPCQVDDDSGHGGLQAKLQLARRRALVPR